MGRKPLSMDEAQKTDAEKSASLIKISTVYNESCLVKEKKKKIIKRIFPVQSITYMHF